MNSYQGEQLPVAGVRVADKNILIFINVSLLCLVLSTPWLFSATWPNHLLTKWSIAGVSSAVLLLWTLWKLPYKPHVSLHISWIKSCFLLLFFLGGLSIFWSINTDFTISKWLLWWIGFSTFITAYHLNSGAQGLTSLSWGLFSSAGLIALIGVMQYWWGVFTLAQYAPPAATFGNRNIATHVIVLILPVGLYLLAAKNTRVLQTWLITMTMAIIMAYISYTKTRSSWVAVVVQMILIAGFLYWYRHRLHQFIAWQPSKTMACWLSLGVFLLLINLGPSGWTFFFTNALERIDDIGSVNARLDIWAMTFAMIRDNPIWGSGLGSWYQNEIQAGYVSASGMSFLRAHNDLLELAAELGLVGVMLLLCGAVAITAAVLTMLKVSQGKLASQFPSDTRPELDNKAWFCFLLWVALAGSFVQMQFTFPYQESVPVFLFGLYVGLISRYSEAFVGAIKTVTVSINRGSYWAIRGLACGVALLSLFVYWDWLQHNLSINRLINHQIISKSPLPTPYIMPNYYPFELRFLSARYKEDSQIVQTIEEQALEYWPNDVKALENLLEALIEQENYTYAWQVIQHLRSFQGTDYYFDDFAALTIYRQTDAGEEFIKTFVHLLKQEEHLLSQRETTYRNLLRRSRDRAELMQFTEYLYNKGVQYHGYDCHTEQHIAAHFWQQTAYASAVEHLQNISNSNDRSCLNPVWDGLLQQYQLAIQLDQAQQK